jgi:hypothetical protein
MQVRKGSTERFDILGNRNVSVNEEPLKLAQKLWQNKTGYFSLLAGFTTVFAAGATDVLAKSETESKVPTRVAQQATEIVSKLNKACSKPELLRLQTGYMLPHQKSNVNLVDEFAGGDACPGVAIPGGTYTAAAPFQDTGSTTGANNTVNNIGATCSDYAQVAGPDHIYSFQLSARGANPQISVTGAAGYDTSIYILNGTTGVMCPAGTGIVANNCLQGADSTLAAGTETINAAEMGTLPLNTPLYLFIDSFYASGALSNGGYTVRIQDITIPGGGPPPVISDAPVDMNGDGKTDYVVVRNTTGGPSGETTWYTLLRDGAPTQPTAWGIASDFFVPADYDADGKSDIAVWRPGASGTAAFYILNSATSTIRVDTFGQTGDDPTVVADYNNDDRDDVAVYREGATAGDQSVWYVKTSTNFYSANWGLNGDFPAPGDYDGDGRSDMVVQRPSGSISQFYKWLSSNGSQSVENFGSSTAAVVPGDYDDDGKTDVAVIDDQGGTMVWSYEPSSLPGITVVSDTWGFTATDIPVQGDYTGDGATDYAIWRPSTGEFWVMTSGTRNISKATWGVGATDYPVANYNVH